MNCAGTIGKPESLAGQRRAGRQPDETVRGASAGSWSRHGREPAALTRVSVVTVGHGTLEAPRLCQLIEQAGVDTIIDVRSIPGSRHNPQFNSEEMARWLPDCGVSYRWEPRLGGFRKVSPTSPHLALRHPRFRAYADYMDSADFRLAFDLLLSDARRHRVAILCAETLWWRCHRRLIADATVLLGGTQVLHLGHNGKLEPHRLTDGVRVASRRLLYDVKTE